MKITLVNIQEPEALFHLLNTCTGPVSCHGVDLRHNQELEKMICGMVTPAAGIPQLELTVSQTDDFYRFLRYMREGAKIAA